MTRLARWRLRVGRRGTVGAIVLLAGLLGAAAVPVLDGSQAHYVHVRWHPSITAEQQQQLEWQHGLRRRSGTGRSFGYDLVNESSWNIRALLDNPFVEDTHDLDRDTASVAEGAPAGKARNGLAWRWGLESRVTVVATWARRLLLCGVLILLCSRPVTPFYVRTARLLPDVRERQGRRSLGIGLSAAGALLLAVIGPLLQGAPSRSIAIRWQEGTSPDARQAREARYGLRQQHSQGRTDFRYDLVDDSAANIRALATDLAVVSIEGIDRERGVVLPTAPLGGSRTGLGWRWGVERYLAPVEPSGWLLLAVGALVVAGWARIRRVGVGLAFLAGAVSGEVQGAWAWSVRYPERVRRLRTAVAVAGVFLFALLLRWATLGGLGGDDHMSLATAAPFLRGDRPFQDFVDPGYPLFWAMSALAQVVVGYRTIGEVGLGLLLIALAIALTFRLSWKAGGSFFIALGLAVMTAILVTQAKLYSYPKIFVYPMGVWLAWRYIDRPGLLRAFLLALGVAIGFGYRHDHGAYLAVGASAAVLAVHWRRGPADLALALCRVGVLTLAILSPYLVLIEVNEGLIPYFDQRIKFAAQTDADGRQPVPFVVDRTAPLLVTVSPPSPIAVAVRWKNGMSPQQQLELEHRHHLEPVPSASPGSWHRYVIADYSERNLTALFAEKYVVTVEGVIGSFRRGYALDEPEGESSATPAIAVSWKTSATKEQVEALERAHHLFRRAGTLTNQAADAVAYDVGDPSPANITALREQEFVRDIQGVHFVRVPVSVAPRERVPVGPPVLVYWAPSVSPTERAMLERQHRLLFGRVDQESQGRVGWRYELADSSESNVTALVGNSRVLAVDGVEESGEPGAYRVRPWDGPRLPHMSIVWRRDITDAQLRERERRYHLEPDDGSSRGMVAYRLAEASPERIAALARDPQVVEISGLDARQRGPVGEGWFSALRREYAFLRIVPLPRLFVAANGGVWLYYLCLLLPVAVLAVLSVDWLKGRVAEIMPGEAQKMFAVAVLMGVANYALMRKLRTFPDHFDGAALMGAWLLARAVAAQSGSVSRIGVRTAAAAVAAVSIIAVSAYVNASTFGGLTQAPAEQWAMSAEKFRFLTTSPPIDAFAPRDSTHGDRAVFRYLYDCTRPDDRIFVTSDAFAVPYLTERRVVGHVFWASGLAATPDFERQMIALMERDPVPVVFGVGGGHPLDNLLRYPLVRAYVAQRFTERHAILQDHFAGKVLWLLTDSRRRPSGTYKSLGLPCFK